MLIFNCTKSAAEFFTATKKGKKTSPIQPVTHKTILESITCPFDNSVQWHWLVHAIKVKRKNVLIVMDYHSRYSITLTCLKKGDWIAFLNMFEHHLNVNVNEVMALTPVDDQFIDESLNNYFQTHQKTIFHLRGDRSVQGHINDVAWHFEMSVDESGSVPQEVELIGFDNYANRILRNHIGAKDYFYPQHEFLRNWLKQYGELSEIQANEHIKDLEEQERAESRARFDMMKNTIKSLTDQQAAPSNVIPFDQFKNRT